jgi:transposase-like protein
MEVPGGRSLIRAMDDRRSQLRGIITELRRARFPDGIECPRCAGKALQGWGSFSGRRRYRCKSCSRTFSDLTGTPVSNLKKIALLRSYAGEMAKSRTIRATAKAIGISPSTAFRWRHRLLGGVRANRTERLSGEIELNAIRIAESCKGQRLLPRPARRHAWSRTQPPVNQIQIVVALDRYANAVVASVPGQTVEPRALQATMGCCVAADSVVVVAEGWFGLKSSFARRMERTFRVVRLLPKAALSEAIPPSRAYRGDLRRWMKQFRGVATRYLTNYLEWHRGLTYSERHGLAETALRWPVDATNNSREQNLRVREKGTSAPAWAAAAIRGTTPKFPMAPSSLPSASSRAGP